MVGSIRNIGSTSVAPSSSTLGNVRKKISTLTTTIQQSDLISQIEKARNPVPEKIQDLKKETDYQAAKFVQKSSLYARVSLLLKLCNDGVAKSDDENKACLVVKELLKQNKTGFFSIRKEMKKYFPELSFLRMCFFYVLFISWLPGLYIQGSLNKILNFSRKGLKEGDNLPILGSNLLGTMNTYLADYNRTIQRFRIDKDNPLGDRDAYIRQELHKPELLGYPSIDHLHKNFAKAASREDTRPAFRTLSNQMTKFQFLDFEFLKKHLNIVRTVLLPITMILGTIPYLAARIIEFIPNKVIKWAHSTLIKYFMPTVIKNTLASVSQPGFSHAINSFLCDVIQDLLAEMKKKPEEKTIEEIPNIVNEALSNDIKKFSEFLYTLLKNEQCKTQEELEYLKVNGPDPKSLTERLLKLFTSKGFVNDALITPTFVEALHSSIIDGFNLLFSKPEKLEEYLCNLIVLLNTVFDYVPDPKTKDGLALLEEMKEKHKRREKLVNEVISKGINLAAEDTISIGLSSIGLKNLTRHQKENISLSYRKIEKKASERLPDIAKNAFNIFNSSSYLNPSSAQAQSAKEDIKKAMNDIKRLFVAISNDIPDDNDTVKKQMCKHLKQFLQKEQILKDTIIQIDHLHDKKEGIKSLKSELESLKQTLESAHQTPSKIISAIEAHLNRLNEINSDHLFDNFISQYANLDEQLKKIRFHNTFADKLQALLTTSFFSNNPIDILAKAQKEYLLHPTSKNKEQTLVNARNKIQEFLNQLETSSPSQDVTEIKLAVKKILDTQHTEQIDEEYKNALTLVRKKITKHKSLYKDEQGVLPKYFDKCRTNIENQIAQFPKMTQDAHADLLKQTELLTTTVENMQKNLPEIEKQNFTDSIDKSAIAKILISIASCGAGYLGLIGKTLSIALGSTSLGSTYLTPTGFAIGTGKKIASSLFVPLARSTADSAYGLITNQEAFLEGLIHKYMGEFIKYVKENKDNL